MPEFQYILYRSSEHDPKKAIGERKVLYASSLTEARQKIRKMPAVIIGGKAYNPKLIVPK